MEKPYNSFKEYMETYEIDELREIVEHGCVSGCAGGLIYYSDTCAFYDQFCDELHDMLGDWIDEIGETPTFITDQLGHANGFKNALVWFAAEQYANEIIQTLECEAVDHD
jgi:hypothetical protein